MSKTESEQIAELKKCKHTVYLKQAIAKEKCRVLNSTIATLFAVKAVIACENAQLDVIAEAKACLMLSENYRNKK